MDEENKINPNHRELRKMLRLIGPLVFILGLVLTLVGLGSFFSSFGSMQPPRYFWCAFLGLPLMTAGGAISQFAFMGAVARFMAGETAPVAKDTFNYMASGTKDGVRDIASAIAEGVSANSLDCNSCRASNDIKAKFCDNCGETLLATKTCDHCTTENQKNAKFCDDCGRKFPMVN